MELVLREQRPEAGDAVSFVFDRPPGLEWKAGQYFGLRVEHPDPDARGVTRTFTIASAPEENVVMVTTRKRGDTSSLKRALLALQPGDRVALHRPPGGDFVAPEEGEHVFIARGIGITPFRAMLAHLARRLGQAPVTLIYATGGDVVYRHELDRLAARSPWLTIRYVLEPEVVTGPLLRETVTNGHGVWVAGPAVMVHAVTGLLAMTGVPEERVRTEAFPGY
jgi:glycine betaine catabolism B